ncbi:hypothetical protein C7S18_16760 [Ahniella affigens]|uniref:Uncharacterized protein n=1 Tax=Ahniella affigens TaxID=2021234 RepID=A0A2P1PV70_9GAMM|nr:hypothetical protein [Ahniella affigens]AVP98738.1 hypothetical protein C7S18_16760 [Ahniella affigens]
MKPVKTMLFAICVTLAGTSAAFTAKQPDTAIPNQYAVNEFSTIADGIRIQMEPGGRYANVPNIDRPQIEDQLSVMASLLNGVASVEDLNPTDKVRLFNAQERVNSLLLQHDNERLFCEKTRVTGSHRPRTVCMTYAEREAARESAARLFRTYDRGISPEPNG